MLMSDVDGMPAAAAGMMKNIHYSEIFLLYLLLIPGFPDSGIPCWIPGVRESGIPDSRGVPADSGIIPGSLTLRDCRFPIPAAGTPGFPADSMLADSALAARPPRRQPPVGPLF